MVLISDRGFRSDIPFQDWDRNLFNSEDPNIMWAEWKSKFLTIADLDKHAPIQTKRFRFKNFPWKISELKNICMFVIQPK